MTPPATPSPASRKAFNAALTAVVAQVGCFTPVIIIGFLFAGIWLDGVVHSKPLFTIVFILVSMPISILVLMAIVRSATKRLKSENEKSPEISSEGGL